MAVHTMPPPVPLHADRTACIHPPAPWPPRECPGRSHYSVACCCGWVCEWEAPDVLETARLGHAAWAIAQRPQSP